MGSTDKDDDSLKRIPVWDGTATGMIQFEKENLKAQHKLLKYSTSVLAWTFWQKDKEDEEKDKEAEEDKEAEKEKDKEAEKQDEAKKESEEKRLEAMVI